MKKKYGIEIVICDDGFISCFVIDSFFFNEDFINNIFIVGDVVIIFLEEVFQFQIVIDDVSNIQNIISIEDLVYVVFYLKFNIRLVKEIIVKSRIVTVVKEYEVVEVIEGLQVLVGQLGIIQFIIESQKQDIMEIEVIIMENLVEFVEEKEAEKEFGYQLIIDQLMGLFIGDFVEINGEMYKVEISIEDVGNLVLVDVFIISSVQLEIGLSVIEVS